MSYLSRTLRNLWRVGFKEYGHQMQNMGDTKAGRLVGTDAFGNKYYENAEELPLRDRWVDYKTSMYYDASELQPGWHAWLGHLTDTPPSPASSPVKEHLPNQTHTRGAFKTYATVVPVIARWTPRTRSAVHRDG